MFRTLLYIVAAAVLAAFALVAFQNIQDNRAEPTDLELESLVKGNNQFAFDMYRQLAKKKAGNLIFSPYSVSTALAMTYGGARGDTAREMAKVLRFTLGQNGTHRCFHEINKRLKSDGESAGVELHIANALWGQSGYSFRRDYSGLTAKYYDGELNVVDFAKAPEAASRRINDWVKKKTKKKIGELFNPSDVGAGTVLVLTNAAFFKGKWKLPFPTKNTKDATFYVTAEKRVAVPMMQIGNGRFRYYLGNRFELLELPYCGDRFVMLVFLPSETHSIRQFEDLFTPAVFEQALSKLTVHAGDVSLPKFKVFNQFLLTDELENLGCASAFSGAADFSGITGGRGLRITGVIQKAALEVNEDGTLAAAATGVKFAETSPPRFSFRANRPFVCMIYDYETHSILFSGRILQPKS